MFKTFENHNYIKESLIKKKIEKAELTPSEIENNEEYQEIFLNICYQFTRLFHITI